MKKIICALITIMLAGCGSTAAAAVQKSAESKITAAPTASALPVATASVEATASASTTPEAEESAAPTGTPSAPPVTTPMPAEEQKPVDSKQKTSNTVETVSEQQPSAFNNVNPDEQGYWDANGNWVGYGWWNTDASGKAVYHYDGIYHEASVPVSQHQTETNQNEDNADYGTAEQAQKYIEPVQNNVSNGSSIDAVAATYDGQYAGVSCEGVAGQYLGVTYLIYSNVYQVDSPQANDIIAYFDSGWNYKHTAVYLGEGKALHGSYNGAARVASMYLSYPNMVYFRMGGDTCYSQQIYNIAHANGGTAGWLDPLYR